MNARTEAPLRITRREKTAPQVDALIAQGVAPALAALYAARGVTQMEAVQYKLANLPAPGLMKGMAAVVARLSKAIDGNERICIVADYDADGATACAVGLRGLRAMGANVTYLVPNRFEFGYGLTPEIVALAIKETAPQVLVTVDNGIASIDGAAYARTQGVEVIVTDHHLPAAQLPDALIVNPNQPGCTFPTKALAGVGVMFYVLMALRAARGAKEVNLAQWLDLVALGTVADVVPLDEVNRTLVDQGLKRIRSEQCCQGVRALFRVASKNIAQASSQDLGFITGPRINAAGRLSDISLGIECLITDDTARADEIAGELDALNRKRRDIESGMREEALASIKKLDVSAQFSVCLTNETWHQGVIGIVAGRIKDTYNRPTIVFAPGISDDELKGSGRSITGFHLRDALDLVSKRAPTLIKKFGGHAMAAGLSIHRQDFAAFASAFETVSQELLSKDQLERVYATDGAYAAPQVVIADVHALQQAVWGQGFPAPQFDEVVDVLEQKIVGVKHSKLRVTRNGAHPVTALLWNHIDPLPKRIHVVYRWNVNTFNGNESAEMMIEAWAAGDG
jgi:single-stranded-DNA-specific exonuclease